jgi:hypothetical protein
LAGDAIGSSSAGDAPGLEADRPGRVRRVVVLDLLDAEPAAREEIPDRAGQVAADGERTPKRVQPALPPGDAGVVGEPVLQEQHAPFGLQNAPDLGERPQRIVDRAEREGDDRGVDRILPQRQRLGRRADDLEGNGAPAGILASQA